AAPAFSRPTVSPVDCVATARSPWAPAAGRELLDQLLLPARTREPDRAGTADKSTPRALGQSKPPQCGPCHANAHCAVIVRDSPAARWPCHVSARSPAGGCAHSRASACNHAGDLVQSRARLGRASRSPTAGSHGLAVMHAGPPRRAITHPCPAAPRRRTPVVSLAPRAGNPLLRLESGSGLPPTHKADPNEPPAAARRVVTECVRACRLGWRRRGPDPADGSYRPGPLCGGHVRHVAADQHVPDFHGDLLHRHPGYARASVLGRAGGLRGDRCPGQPAVRLSLRPHPHPVGTASPMAGGGHAGPGCLVRAVLLSPELV